MLNLINDVFEFVHDMDSTQKKTKNIQSKNLIKHTRSNFRP